MTQVPQFILDDAIERGRGAVTSIICTQPRRISAIGVATRVAAERCEPLGQTVGYQIRLESKRSSATRLLFCTTGVLLRRLHGDKGLQGVSHVIVDEVHERSLQSDFLLIILRDLVRRQPHVRVVLMSATVNATLFANYFAVTVIPNPVGTRAAAAAAAAAAATLTSTDAATAAATPSTDTVTTTAWGSDAQHDASPATVTTAAPSLHAPAQHDALTSPATVTTAAPSLHIPGFTHPVAEAWLEDVLTMTRHLIEPGSQYAKRERRAERGGGAEGLGFSEMVAQVITCGLHLIALDCT